MRAVHLAAFGAPIDNLHYVEIDEPAPPRANEVLIGVEFSPLNLSDLLVARGVYPIRPKPPSPIGNEGVGRVLAVGSEVANVKVGDRVLTPLYGWAWAERIVAPAAGLFALPLDADVQQLSMLSINPPTAALLLSEFVNLRPGDWVVQNAANSGVGRGVIAFAKARGLRTVNLVRRPELVAELQAAGGDLVFVDGPDARGAIKDAVGAAAPRLALDGIAGEATLSLAAIAARDGVIVAYSGLSRAPASISSLDLIFKRITLKGFSLGDPEYAPKIQQTLAEAAAMVRSGALYAPVAATYPLSAIREAVGHVERGGKVLLDIAARG